MKKWFTFGRDADFDAAKKAFDEQLWGESAYQFEKVVERCGDPTLRSLAKQFLVQAWSRLGDESIRGGHPMEAIPMYQRAIGAEPGFLDLRLRLIAAHVATNDLDAARELAQSLYENHPENKWAQALYLATSTDTIDWTTIQSLTQFEGQSVLDLTHFLLEPTGQSRIANAKQFVEREDFENALPELQELVLAFPGYADLHYNLGVCYAGGGELQKAKDAMQSALYINPKYADALAGLGVVFRRLGDHEAALECFKDCLAVDPNHPIASEEKSRT